MPPKDTARRSEKEKETDEKKQAESKDGKQFVDNADKAKSARRKAPKDDGEENNTMPEKGSKQKSNSKKGKNKSSNRHQKENEEEDDDDTSEAVSETDAEDNAPKRGQKRRADSKQDQEPAKKSQKKGTKQDSSFDKKSGKTFGSRHDDADTSKYGEKGSTDRLPKKGQDVHWKAMPGFVDGKVVEILKKGKSVDGKSVKASESDPKIVLKSNASGKICVHKPSAVYF